MFVFCLIVAFTSTLWYSIYQLIINVVIFTIPHTFALRLNQNIQYNYINTGLTNYWSFIAVIAMYVRYLFLDVFLHPGPSKVVMDGIVRCSLKSLHTSIICREVVEEQVAISSTRNVEMIAGMIADHRRYARVYWTLVFYLVSSSLGQCLSMTFVSC